MGRPMRCVCLMAPWIASLVNPATPPTYTIAMRVPNTNTKPSKMLVFGHHGVGNVGDDAMLTHAIDQLKASNPEVEIGICAGDLTDDEWCRCHRITRHPRTPLSLLRALAQYDQLVLLGGTHIHSTPGTSRYNVINGMLALVLSVARAAGKDVMMAGVGIGPIGDRLGASLARIACRQASFISVRDHRSFACVSNLRLKRTRVVQCSDPAYGLGVPSVERVPTRLGVSAMPFHASYMDRAEGDGQTIRALCAAVESWIRLSSDHDVLLLPFNSRPGRDQDHQVLLPILRRFEPTGRVRIAPYLPNPQMMLGTVAGCGAMIGMRYHSVLYGHMTSTPMVVIEYHMKTRALVEEIGFPTDACIEVRSLGPDKLREMVERLASNPPAHRASKGPEMFHSNLRKIWPSPSH